MPNTLLSRPKPKTPASTAAPLHHEKLLALVGYNCRRASIHMLRVFSRRMAPLKLKPVDHSVLILIQSNPKITQKRLACALAIDPPNMATLLDRLESRRLLHRERNPADGRSQFLSLTPAGSRLVTRAEEIVNQLELDATAALTDADRRELNRLLQKIFVD